MKTKYHRVRLFATQGGGTAYYAGNGEYRFHQVPNWGDFQKDGLVPDEWGMAGCGEALTILPKKVRKIESRNKSEGTFQSHHNHWNRVRGSRRKYFKKAKLAIKGTLRSITKPRINAIMHLVEIEMKRDEKRKLKKA